LEARRLEIERKRSAESIESKDTHLHFSLAKKNTHTQWRRHLGGSGKFCIYLFCFTNIFFLKMKANLPHTPLFLYSSLTISQANNKTNFPAEPLKGSILLVIFI